MHSKRILMGLTIATLATGCGVLPPAPGTQNDENPPAYVNVVRSDQIHIRLVPQAMNGAVRNQHPAAFQPVQLRALLGSLRLAVGDGQAVGLSSPARMEDFATGLSKAFAQAGSRQDVAFVVFRAQSGLVGSVTGSKHVTSGRMFYRDNTLNVVFGVLDDEVSPFKNSTIDDFDYGSRGRAGTVQANQLVDTGTWHFHEGRRDWIEMPATREAIAAAGVAAPEIIQSSAGRAADSFDYGPAADTAARQEAAKAAPMASPGAATPSPSVPVNGPGATAPVVVPPAAASPQSQAMSSPSDESWQRIENRLTQLKRLREKNLISEQDYQAKKNALLEQLP